LGSAIRTLQQELSLGTRVLAGKSFSLPLTFFRHMRRLLFGCKIGRGADYMTKAGKHVNLKCKLR